MNRPLIDVMIPTFNEAMHIAETVENAKKVGAVYVLDSFSTDGTQEIARKAGAIVLEHKFENYSRQKNWGLDNIPWGGRWIFILDADERITPELSRELKEVATSGTDAVGFFVNRVVIMMGRQIRHGGLFPSWNLRFFQRDKCRYEDRSVHEHMIAQGRTDYLKNLMLHIRRESISEYLSKHIRYADLESDEWIKQRLGHGKEAQARSLFKNILKYRLYLRRDIWPRMPLRPVLRFFYMYFARFGFLDGRAGWHLAMLMASYEYMITLLYKEKMHRFKEGTLVIPGLEHLSPHAVVPPAGAAAKPAVPGASGAPAGKPDDAAGSAAA